MLFSCCFFFFFIVCPRVNTCTHVYVCICMCIYIYSPICGYIHTYIHAYIRTYILTYKQRSMRTHVHAYIHTYIQMLYAHTHTHLSNASLYLSVDLSIHMYVQIPDARIYRQYIHPYLGKIAWTDFESTLFSGCRILLDGVAAKAAATVTSVTVFPCKDIDIVGAKVPLPGCYPFH